MKLFISQPMRGKTNEEILAERERAIKSVVECFGEPVEVIDSFFADTTLSPLVCLAKSIELMANADVAYFVNGWEDARGCRIENECAIAYDIRYVIEGCH